MSNYLLSHCNFIHIPKCGGTALNSALWKIGVITDRPSQIITTPAYGHLFASQMPENGKPFFSFVRHPVSWWMSFYHWNLDPLHSRFSQAERETTSFDEWIQDYGQFWLGQYTILVMRYLGRDPKFPSANKVELVGRTENLFRDLKTILIETRQPYSADVLDDLIAGRLKLDSTLSNTQAYDRRAVSQESKKIIYDCENYMYRNFGYHI